MNKPPRWFIGVVDDEEPIRRGLERLLRSFDFDVRVFATGADFLASLAERRPDCVILDLNMPSLDGFAVVERMVGMQMSVPVIVITGRDNRESRERARQLGVSDYLLKPIDGHVLQQAILDSQKDS